ncbi:MAG TPA: SRPBCC domain-containing protein [Acidimicrobiales bacterium]|nr:SRPBCC domain-containing protein [Acidimicrobiales bacterium]
MEITNEFRVNVPVEEAWKVLTDVERIAPCLPGAQLQEIEGDEYRGVVKVKVGPITAQYKGRATFKSKDDAGHVAVLKAEGRDTRGQGNASALITATLTPEGDRTAVKVETNLTITGKVAQFGRGVLVDVSGKLLTQFVECLEHDLLSASSMAASGASSSTSTNGSTSKPAATPEPVAASAEPAKKVEAPVEKAAPEPVAASAAPAKKVEAPVEKSTPEPVPAAPKVAETATPPHGDTLTPREPAVASAAAPAAQATAAPSVADTATPPHGDQLMDTASDEKPRARKIDHAAAEPVDLLEAAGVPVAKRAIPVVAGVLVILWFLRRRRARRR